MPSTLTPAQATIAKDLHRFRVVNCGRRFGKTTLAVEEIKGKAISAPNRRIAYIAPTYQQARDIAWDMLKKELHGATLNVNESRLELTVATVKGGESMIVLRGWEAVETLRGQAFDLIILDEVASYRNFWVGWQEVLRPTLTDRKGEAMFISTPKGFNHFYDLFNTPDKDFANFRFTTYDNPFIPIEEIEDASNQITPDRFSQEYMADFTKSEGLIYKEFRREKHTYDELPETLFTETISGIDFGFTHPAAVLTIKIDHAGTYWVDDEWYKTQRTDLQIAEYAEQQKFNYVYPDPESPSAIEELKRKNINVREVSKGMDSVEAGIDKVREFLLADKLKINKKCVNLIYEFESYAYKEGSEKPEKENDHALDALRYALTTHKIREVKREQYRPNWANKI